MVVTCGAVVALGWIVLTYSGGAPRAAVAYQQVQAGAATANAEHVEDDTPVGQERLRGVTPRETRRASSSVPPAVATTAVDHHAASDTAPARSMSVATDDTGEGERATSAPAGEVVSHASQRRVRTWTVAGVRQRVESLRRAVERNAADAATTAQRVADAKATPKRFYWSLPRVVKQEPSAARPMEVTGATRSDRPLQADRVDQAAKAAVERRLLRRMEREAEQRAAKEREANRRAAQVQKPQPASQLQPQKRPVPPTTKSAPTSEVTSPQARSQVDGHRVEEAPAENVTAASPAAMQSANARLEVSAAQEPTAVARATPTPADVESAVEEISPLHATDPSAAGPPEQTPGGDALAPTNHLIAFFNIGYSANRPKDRMVGQGLKQTGWDGFVQIKVRPLLDWGVRRIQLHNPFGAKEGDTMRLDQYLLAKEAELDWLTDGFVEAWKPVIRGDYTNGEPVEVIGYVGHGFGGEFKRLREAGDLRGYRERAAASIKPLVQAGMSIGFDSASVAEDDDPY